jgi:putative RNA 2'-phosphotransferase
VGDCIRSNYGHSLSVDIDHPVVTPPEILYHGTAAKGALLILQEGMKPMQRQFVHLTTDIKLAKAVGGRHGLPVVMTVYAERAHLAGIEFRKANGMFWLCKFVPVEFIKRI